VPKDFWPTYSAMANAHGGVVLLGVREKDGVFSIAGIPNPAKVRADLFNNLNNPGKVSANLLTDADVQELALQGQTMLLVRIPQATRKQRPVFLNGQPLGHTYKRLNDGDRPCDEETVKRMLAEQVEDERDARILPGFGMGDIDGESLRIYRQMLKDERPGHPYLEQDDFDFMTSLRGWRRDRQTGQEGLTLAGLLMFGTWAAIQEAAPHYFVDYQERPEARAEPTWIDRLVPDGSWTGNLFEFYRRVYRKLVADLKVPFAVKDGQRQDDTPVHKALREALVNALVHADYTGRVSVLVVKRPDMFGFRNPGGLRLPIEQVIRGAKAIAATASCTRCFCSSAWASGAVQACRAFMAAGAASTGGRPCFQRRPSLSRRCWPCTWRICCRTRWCRRCEPGGARVLKHWMRIPA
jgi:ATP-dependent DNA helicase RecG